MNYLELYTGAPPPEPKPSREDTWDDPAWRAWHQSHPDSCREWWDIPLQRFTRHGDDCEYPEFDPATWEQVAAAREKAANEAATAKQPKSRSRGRIYDRESSRREAQGMFNTSQNDPRLTPCARFVHARMAAKWFESGSVFVPATRGWLAAQSDDRFTEDQCRTALRQLQRLGYIVPQKWSQVKKKDRGLYDWMKAQRAGIRGDWPAVYQMKQDLPDSGHIPEEENPILQAITA